MLTVLGIAYPMARVGPYAVGGAEQVLTMIDAALVRAGHRSLVIACAGSHVAGELIAVPAARAPFDTACIARARERHATAISDALRRYEIDLIHAHGHDYDAYLPPPGAPLLVTLHCPRPWYSAGALAPTRADTYLNAVSATQHEGLLPHPRLLPPIANGVVLGGWSGLSRKRSFALVLARIAPEKGIHNALAAAHAAGIPLIIAGEVFPFPEHERYFAQEVAPRLDRLRQFVGPVGAERKRRLLAAARCLLVCSEVEETSSLVAREALAAGTPVVALRRGALAETIEHGRTGVLVDSFGELPQAIAQAREISPAACRRAAEERFDARAMTASYIALYAHLAKTSARSACAATVGLP